MIFKKYPHVERFGNGEVEGIELGETWVFPKLDGTNSSAWLEWTDVPSEEFGAPHTTIAGGSRNRRLSKEADNAGFLAWLHSADAKNVQDFLLQYPNLRLYGEWLVPHSFKGYRDDAWRRFYVFDVMNDSVGEDGAFMSYEQYQPLMEEYKIDYIPPLAKVRSGAYDQFLHILKQNFFMIPDGGEPGEGIVIKNYDYQNKFGRYAIAKIIRNEFKEMHAKAMGPNDVNGTLMNEERIIELKLSPALVEKTYAKILVDRHSKDGSTGWSSKYIPELFNRVFYDIIKEELWDAWKEIGFGTLNGKTLKALTINRIKQLKPELF